MGIISKIKEKLKNKDAKTLLENFISLSVLQLINLILPLVTLPYMVDVVGFEKYGIVVLALSLITYFQSLTDYSFTITGTRDVAVFKTSLRKLQLIYSKIMTVKIFFLSISFVILLVLINTVDVFYNNHDVFFYSFLILIGYVLFPEWFFQGIEKMKYITILNSLIKIILTVCVFVFIKSEADLWMYPMFLGLGYIVSGIIGQYILWKKYHIRFLKIKRSVFISALKDNFPVFVNQFMPTLFNNTSIFIMGLVVSTYAIGVFDAVKKIIMIESVFMNVVSRVFFPFLNRNRDRFKIFAKYSLLSLAAIILGVLLIHPLLFWLFRIVDDYAFIVLLILSIGIFCVGIYSVYATNYLLVYRKDKDVMRITFISSIIGFVASYPLIYFLGVYGGALNIMLSQFLLGSLAYLEYRAHSKNNKLV